MCLFFYYLLSLIFNYLDHIKEKVNIKSKLDYILDFIFNKHPIISTITILLLIFVPLLIIAYPGDIGPDSIDELKQFYHIRTWSVNYINLINENVYINGHHSPFHTIIIGMINSLGLKISSPNMGLFLNVILQVAIAIFVLTYCINSLKKLQVPIKLRILILLFYIFSGFFTFGTLSIYKDVPFFYMTLLYSVQLIEIIHLDNYKTSNIIKISITGFIMSILTKKGIYALILVVFALTVILIKRKEFKKMSLLYVPIFIFYTIENILFPHLGVTPGSIKEMIALPIQQVGRVVYYYDEKIPIQDKETINNIIEYDKIKDHYNPKSADALKNTFFNKDYTKNQLKDFIKLYVKYFFKYPSSYFSSFFNLCSGYFNINATVKPNGYSTNYDMINDKKIDFTKTQNHSKAFKLYNKIYNLIVKVPVINIIYSQGLYQISLLILMVYITLKKEKKSLIPFIPSLVILLFLLISPVDNNRRYFLPIIATIPMLIAYVSILNNKVKKNKTS